MRRFSNWAWLYAPLFLSLSSLSVATQDQSAAQVDGAAAPAESAGAASNSAVPAVMAAPSEKPYTVECDSGGNNCKVDKATYIGWRTFNSACHVCHAQDGVGSTFAPSLVKRLTEIDKAEFMNAMENGFKGQVGVMPAWKDDPNVNRYFEELYSYLMARADGILPTGRPGRIR